MNNKAYRVIWNDQLGTYVAVPEFASAKGKSGGAVVVATASCVASFFMHSAWADPTAANAQTQVYSGLNGVPVVDIATANGAGLSHNKYNSFNVSANGLVLNNNASALPIQSQLAGQVERNLNLHKAATLILNEVVTQNRSILNGYMEVAGSRADVIVANPWGITCSGCGFINTDRATLTTGVPTIGADGGLYGFKVNQGDVQVEGTGIDGKRINILDIVARSVVLNGQAHGNDLKLVLGNNEYRYATRVATAQAGSAASIAYAIDSTLLGGMYANKIGIIATEQGVGVRMLGDVAASGSDFTLTAAGKVELQSKLSAAQDVSITSTASVDQSLYLNQGSVSAGRDLTLNAQSGQVRLADGTLHAGGDLQLRADSLVDTSTGNAQRFATRNQTWSITGNTALEGAQFGAGGRMDWLLGALTVGRMGASIYSGSDAQAADRGMELVATGGDLGLNGATVLASGGLGLSATAGAVSVGAAGTVQVDGVLNVSAFAAIRNAGSVLGAQQIDIQALGTQTMLDNSGTLQATGNLALGERGRSIALNNSGTLLAGDVLSIEGAALTNSGTVQATNGTTIQASSLDNSTSAAKWLLATTDGTAASITLLEGLRNAGSLQNTGNLTLAAQGDIRNQGDMLVQSDDGVSRTLDITGSTITNSGNIGASGATTLAANSSTGTAMHNSGQIHSSGAQLSLKIAGGVIENTASGKLLADHALKVSTNAANAALSNAGRIQSLGAMTLGGKDHSFDLSNSGTDSVILSDSSLAITGGALINEGSIQAKTGSVVTGSSLNNSGTLITSTQAGGDGSLALSGDLTNVGALQSAGGLALDVGSNTVVNSGKLLANGTSDALTITAAQLSNTATGAIKSEGTTAITASAAAGNGMNNEGTLYSVGQLDIDATANVNNSGRLLTDGELELDAKAITNSDVVQAKQGAIVTADRLTNTGKESVFTTSTQVGHDSVLTLKQGLDNQGTLQSAAGLDIDTKTSDIQNSGTIYAAGTSDSLSLQGKQITNAAGGTIQGNGATTLVATQGSIDNSGTVYGKGSLSVTAAADIRNAQNAQLLSNTTLQLQTQAANAALSNAGRIQSLGAMTLGGADHRLDLSNSGTDSVILSDSSLAITGGAITNEGAIQAKTGSLVTASSFKNTGASSAFIASTVAGEDARLTLTGDLTNEGVLQSSGGLALDVGSNKVINSGKLVANGASDALTITAAQLSNTATGAIKSEGATAITANAAAGNGLNNEGTLYSVGQLDIYAAANVSNSGKLLTDGALELRAHDINNRLVMQAQQGANVIANSLTNSLSDSDLLEVAAQEASAQESNTQIENPKAAVFIVSTNALHGGSFVLEEGLANQGTLQSAGGLNIQVQSLGVRNSGTMFAAGESSALVVHADQITNSGILQGNGSVTLEATQTSGNSIDNSGTVYAQGNLGVTAGADIANAAMAIFLSDSTLQLQTQALTAALHNAGSIQSKGEMTLGAKDHKWDLTNAGQDSEILSAANLRVMAGAVNNQGAIQAQSSTVTASSLQNDGTIITATPVDVASSEATVNTKSVEKDSSLTLTLSGNLINSGTVYAQGSLGVTAGADITNAAAAMLLSDSTLQLQTKAAKAVLHNAGRIQSQGEMTLGGKDHLWDLTNEGVDGVILSAADLSVAAGAVANQGVIQAQSITVTASSLENEGALIAATAVDVESSESSESIVGTASVEKDSSLTLTLSGDLTNSGTVHSEGGLTVDAGVHQVHNSGKLIAASSQQHLQINTQDISNQAGGGAADTAVVNHLVISAVGIDNSGELYSAQNLQLEVADALTNSGDIIADNRLEIHAGHIGNKDLLQSKKGSEIRANTFSNAQGATLIASTAEDTQSELLVQGNISNAGLVQTAGALTISTEASIYNDVNARIVSQSSAAADLNFAAKALRNQGIIKSSANIDMQMLNGSNEPGAGLVNDTTADISAAGILTIDLQGNLTNHGFVEAQRGALVKVTGNFINGDVDNSKANFILNVSGVENSDFQKIQASTITNEAVIHSAASLDLIATDKATLKNGANAGISSLSNLSATALGDIENFGTAYAQGNLIFNTSESIINNEGADITSEALFKVDSKNFNNYAAIDAASIDIDVSDDFFNGLREIPEVIEDTSVDIYKYAKQEDQNRGYTIIHQNDELRCGLYCDGVIYYEKFFTYKESLAFELPAIKPQIIAGDSIDIQYKSGDFTNIGGLISAQKVSVGTKGVGSFKNQDIVTYDNTYSLRTARYEHDPDVGSRWYSWYSPQNKNAFSQVHNDYPNNGSNPWKSIDGSKNWDVSTGTAEGFDISYVNSFGKVLTSSYGAGIFAKEGIFKVDKFENIGSTAQQPNIDKKTVNADTKDPIKKDEVNVIASTDFTASLDLKSTADGKPLANGIDSDSADTGLGIHEVIKSIDNYDGVQEKSSNYQKDIAVLDAKQLSAAEAIRQQSSISLGEWVLKLPSNPNGKFVPTTDPQSKYLIETNPRFSVGGVVMSADYLEKRLGYSPEQNLKRLGDANYEAYLVRQQLVAETGRNVLSGYNDEAAQLQKFMNQAVEQASQLQLEYGKALTDAQVAGLTADIVWMEVINVGGIDVLAPRVYLSAATKAMITGGAVIEGETLEIEAASVSNTGGTIAGSHKLAIKSTGDVTNTSGTIQGGGVSVTSSTGTITNQTSVQGYGDALSYRTDIGKTAAIKATGNMALNAAASIQVLGADVKADGDITLQAGQSVTFDTVVDKLTVSNVAGITNTTSTSQKNIGSNLVAGGELKITSGEDITIAGSTISADSLSVDSQGDFNILARQDTTTSHSVSSSSGLGVGGGVYGSEKKTTDSFTSTSVGSAVTVTGDAAIKTQGTTTLQGSSMDIGGDADIQAKQGIQILDAENIERTTTVTETTTYLKFTSDSDSSSGADSWSGASSSADSSSGASAGSNKGVHQAQASASASAEAYAGAGAGASADASNDSSLRLMEQTTTTEKSSTTTSVGSSLSVGGNLKGDTDGTLTIKGSAIRAEGDVDLSAKNVEVLAGRNESSVTKDTSVTSIGFYAESSAGAEASASAEAQAKAQAKAKAEASAGQQNLGWVEGSQASGSASASASASATGNASANASAQAESTLTIGAMHEEEHSSEQSVTHSSSSIQSGGNMRITAKENATFVGAQVESGGDLDISAENITNKAAQDTYEKSSSSRSDLAGLYIGAAAEAKVDAEANVKAQVKLEAEASVGASTNTFGGALTTANANADASASANAEASADASASANAEAEVTAGIHYQNKQSSEVEGAVTQVTNSFAAKGSITRTAKDTITDQGTQMEAGGNIDQTARVINDEAVSDSEYSSSSEQSHDARIGAYLGGSASAEAKASAKAEAKAGAEASASGGVDMDEPEASAEAEAEAGVGFSAGLGVKASYTGSISSESSSSTTAVTSRYKAGGNVSSKSDEKTTLSGTEIEAGGDVSLEAGSLDYQAAQDTSTSTSSSHDINGEATVTIIGAAGAEVSAGYEGAIEGDSETSARAGSIQSGGDIRITTAGDANFTGTNIESGGKTAVNAGGDVNFNAVTSTNDAYSHEIGLSVEASTTKGGGKGEAEASYEMSLGSSTTAQGSTIKAGSGLEISSGKSVTLEGAEIESDGDVTVSAHDEVNLKAAVNTETSVGLKFEAKAEGEYENAGSKEDAAKKNADAKDAGKDADDGQPSSADENTGADKKSDSVKKDANDKKNVADEKSDREENEDSDKKADSQKREDEGSKWEYEKKASTNKKVSTKKKDEPEQKVDADKNDRSDKKDAADKKDSADKKEASDSKDATQINVDAEPSVESAQKPDAEQEAADNNNVADQPSEDDKDDEKEDGSKASIGLGAEFSTGVESNATSISSKGKITIKAGTVVNQEAQLNSDKGTSIVGNEVKKDALNGSFSAGAELEVTGSKGAEKSVGSKQEAKPDKQADTANTDLEEVDASNGAPLKVNGVQEELVNANKTEKAQSKADK